MDIYEIAAKRLKNCPFDIKVAKGVKSVPNNSEKKKQGKRKFPLIVQKKGGEQLLLEERDAFIWQMVEQGIGFEQMSIKYFFKFKRLGDQFIRYLISDWTKKGLISCKKDLYNNHIDKSQVASAFRYNKKVIDRFLEMISFDVEVGFFNKFYEFLYKITKFFYNKYILILLIIVSALAIIVSTVFYDTNIEIILESSKLGSILVFLGVNILYFFFHESGHAIALKMYGLKVERVGFRFFLGFPVFYVDTTNAWALERNKRLVVSSAGVFATFLLAGFVSLLKILIDIPEADFLLNQISFVCIVSIAVNLIPFVEFDGYYILVDLLNEPNLKVRSFNALMNVLSGEKKVQTDDVKNLIIYGLLSIIATMILVASSIWFWIDGLKVLFS